jgi:hypothetical protein
VTVSVVVEMWNAAGEPARLRRLVERLVPQLAAHATQLVITHGGLTSAVRDEIEQTCPRPVTWVELPATAGYYDHKNHGFDASTGEHVAFLDLDCDPDPSWLAELIAPLPDGARVVAGATSYAGGLAPLASELDFPYYDAASSRQFAATSARPASHVRNFFANNVAFERATFAARRYPSIPAMFHGQCQVLALRLARDQIPIAFAPRARVTHAAPANIRSWLAVRLLRGADLTQLLPHVVGTYAPRVRAPVAALGPLPALTVLGVRALGGARSALRHSQRLRGLALVAGVTAFDALGASAAPLVHRYLGG